jgi:hypothetical protein
MKENISLGEGTPVGRSVEVVVVVLLVSTGGVESPGPFVPSSLLHEFSEQTSAKAGSSSNTGRKRCFISFVSVEKGFSKNSLFSFRAIGFGSENKNARKLPFFQEGHTKI